MNCRGVNTYIGGSLMLPEVKRAMDDASRQFVGLNERANGIGARLAELTGPETVPNEYLRRGATMGERRGLR